MSRTEKVLSYIIQAIAIIFGIGLPIIFINLARFILADRVFYNSLFLWLVLLIILFAASFIYSSGLFFLGKSMRDYEG